MDDIETLMNQGYAALAAEEYERALEIGSRLRQLRHTSCFEIIARAQWELGRAGEAIATLEEGVKKGPTVADLWEYLGCFYSDLRRYDDARRAMERWRDCPGANRNLALFNLAIVCSREKKPQDAIKLLEQVSPDESLPRVVVDASKARTLNALGRHRDALALINESLSAGEKSSDATEETAEDVMRCVADLNAARGVARLALGEDRKIVYDDAISAVLIRSTEDGMNLLRRLDSRTSAKSAHWRIMINGAWAEPLEDSDAPPGFVRTFDVIADDVREAMEFIRRFEQPSVAASLRADESERLADCPGEFKGVIAAYGHVFYRAGSE